MDYYQLGKDYTCGLIDLFTGRESASLSLPGLQELMHKSKMKAV